MALNKPAHRPKKPRMIDLDLKLDDEFYTVDEVAYFLKLHPSTIRKQIYSGEIKAIKIGKSWRISRDELLNITSM